MDDLRQAVLGILEKSIIPKLIQLKEQGVHPDFLSAAWKEIEQKWLSPEIDLPGLIFSLDSFLGEKEGELKRVKTMIEEIEAKNEVLKQYGNLLSKMPPHLYSPESSIEIQNQVQTRLSRPGVGICLAYLEPNYKGVSSFIEAVALPGKGDLIITGSSDISMRDSVKVAHSVIKSYYPGLDLQKDLHIHFPGSGKEPSGSSAGAAIAATMASCLSGRCLNPAISITGQLSLTGLIHAVSWITEKIRAALHAGCKTVIIPKENHKDIEDLPLDLQDRIEIKLVETIKEALALMLVWDDDTQQA